VLKASSIFVGGCVRAGDNPDGAEPTALAVSHSEKCTKRPKLMGGSDQNTSNSGRPEQSTLFMRNAQSRINTGDYASR
jgi:hypothetical protein